MYGALGGVTTKVNVTARQQISSRLERAASVEQIRTAKSSRRVLSS